MGKKSTYKAKDIEVLEGLEPVRKRPGMYIGNTNQEGLHHLVNEVLDNSIDEVLSGHAKNIDFYYAKDNSISMILRKEQLLIGENRLDVTKDILDLVNKS